MTTWFISDPHFGHQLVSGLRGFATPEEHDAALLGNLRACLREGDITWWLGDIAFNGWQERLPLIGTLPGTHHLVVGNHDRVFPMMSHAENHHEPFRAVFASIQLAARTSIEGQGFRLSHFPYALDSEHSERFAPNADEYAQWRLPDLGWPLIHGHTHSPVKLTYSPKSTPQINVNLEAWDMRPVSAAEVLAVFRTAQEPGRSEAGR